jgi:hypothetical protein
MLGIIFSEVTFRLLAVNLRGKFRTAVNFCKIKVKQFLYRSAQALKIP